MDNHTGFNHGKMENSNEVENDAKAFLASQGISVDADVEAMILSKGMMSASRAPKQASAVHIDL